jgi:hypothetical protein
MQTNKTVLALMVVLAAILTSCYWKNWDTINAPGTTTGGGGGGSTTTCVVTATTVVSYSATIAPLVTTYCATSGACHSLGGVGSPPGSLGNTDFTFYGTAGGGHSSGTGFYAVCSGGDTSSATVWQYIRGASGLNQMPLAGSPQLSACQIKELANWINQGAPQN